MFFGQGSAKISIEPGRDPFLTSKTKVRMEKYNRTKKPGGKWRKTGEGTVPGSKA